MKKTKKKTLYYNQNKNTIIWRIKITVTLSLYFVILKMNLPEIRPYEEQAIDTVVSVINRAKELLGTRQTLKQLAGKWMVRFNRIWVLTSFLWLFLFIDIYLTYVVYFSLTCKFPLDAYHQYTRARVNCAQRQIHWCTGLYVNVRVRRSTTRLSPLISNIT